MSKTDQITQEHKAEIDAIKGLSIFRNSYRLSFTYSGKRENIIEQGLEITLANTRYLAQKLASIKHDISQGWFSWRKYFPNHPKAIAEGNNGQVPTVQEAIEQFIEMKKGETRSLTSYNYESPTKKYTYIKFGGLLVTDITVTMLKHWRSTDLRHLSNKSINNLFIPFRGAFALLSQDRVIDFNPFDHVPNLRVKRNKEVTCDPYTQDELERIAAVETHLQSEQNAYVFACWSGMRVSEWLALAWEDIDLVKRTAKVRRGIVQGEYQATKTDGSYRTVELLEPAYQALLRQKALTYMMPRQQVNILDGENKHWDKHELSFVFMSTSAQKPFWDVKAIAALIDQIVRKAKVRVRPTNQARHTFASLLLTKGVRERWIANQMGHKTLAMLEQHYGTFMNSENPNMAADVSRMFGFNPENNTTTKKVN